MRRQFNSGRPGSLYNIKKFQPRPGGNLAPYWSTDSRPGTKAVNARPHLTPNPHSSPGTPGRYGSPCWPLCWLSREQTDICIQRPPSPLLLMVSPPHRRPTVGRLRADTSPNMRQGGLLIARDHDYTPHSIPTQERHPTQERWSVPGMGFKTLSFFSLVSGGPPERPVALTCVAQTGVVSPGDGQATRYYPPSLIRARG